MKSVPGTPDTSVSSSERMGAQGSLGWISQDPFSFKAMSNVLSLMRNSVSTSNGGDNCMNPFLFGVPASFVRSVCTVSASDVKHSWFGAMSFLVSEAFS